MMRAACGFDVIVYGHTHRPKRVPLAGRTASDGTPLGDRAASLNSGTWADVVAVPHNMGLFRAPCSWPAQHEHFYGN
jgi:hypothetical protein